MKTTMNWIALVLVVIILTFSNSNRAQETCSENRKPIIGGNWKLNPTSLADAKNLVQELKSLLNDMDDVEVVLYPPLPLIYPLHLLLNGSNIKLGSQDIFYETSGAFTGAVSGNLLKEVGVSHVIIGHSERRTIFHENDEVINKKLKKALSDGLKVVLCIGESKVEYDSGLNQAVCLEQLSKDLSGVDANDVKNIVIAYEPIWAIGTGLVCPPAVAQGMHEFIRAFLVQRFGAEIANTVRIQYGGSVNAANAFELMQMADIDGSLVGGASLSAQSFAKIVKAAKTCASNQ